MVFQIPTKAEINPISSEEFVVKFIQASEGCSFKVIVEFCEENELYFYGSILDVVVEAIQKGKIQFDEAPGLFGPCNSE